MTKLRPADAGSDGGRASAPSQSAVRERRLLTLIAASAAVLSFGGLSMRAVSRPSNNGDTLQQAVRDVIARSGSGSPTADRSFDDAAEGGYTAVIIAQPADCDGNLGAFGLLDRELLAARIPHRLLLVQGSAADTVGLRRRLPESLQQAHMALLTREQRSLLRQLGHVATPSLLLFNRSRQLRYASTSPPDPVERTVQIAVITRLVTNHPEPATP